MDPKQFVRLNKWIGLDILDGKSALRSVDVPKCPDDGESETKGFESAVVQYLFSKRQSLGLQSAIL